MANNELFYNRDENISGVTVHDEYSDLNVAASYGSSVTFKSDFNHYETDDFYINVNPNSMNSLVATFDLKYQLNHSDTQEVAAFFESKGGHGLFGFTPDSSGIYQLTSGVCDQYSISHVNNQHFDVDAEITVDQSPNLFNWSGMNFLNHDFLTWTDSAYDYKKYDVVYFEANQNKLDNFYYCTGDHTSAGAALDGPTGASSYWTQDFFYEPDIGFSNTVDFKNSSIDFRNSFDVRLKTKENNASFPVTYNFENISTAETKSILHFLENKGGYRRFKAQIPTIYNRPKVFLATEWSHTWKYVNAHDLTITLMEDVLGVIPTGI